MRKLGKAGVRAFGHLGWLGHVPNAQGKGSTGEPVDKIVGRIPNSTIPRMQVPLLYNYYVKIPNHWVF